jgi:anion-transporting  ArsA/GET3 family ATPase
MDVLKSWFDRKILICMGSGGVGKTTLTTAVALSAAKRGKKVLALTVDPSQRLVRQLGINPNNPEVQEVPLDLGTGKLYASVLNSKWIFDEFVLRHSADETLAKKLMNNTLYQQLSTTLSGSQEFTSLELLCREYEKGVYDLIILDTPPTQHALDFLHAPGQLRQLFDESILKWLRSEGLFKNERWYAKAFQFGTKKVLRAMSLLTGEAFIQSLTDFFQSVTGVQNAVISRGSLFDEILSSPFTGFLAVTAYEVSTLEDTQKLKRALEDLNLNLLGLIVNRTFPFPDMSEQDFKNEKLRQEWEQYSSLYHETTQFFKRFEADLSDKIPVMKLPRRFFVGDQLLDIEALGELQI